MAHTLPSLDQLQKLAIQLIELYKGDNEKRKKFLDFYKRLTEATKFDSDHKKISKILMGALVYELEYIKQVEYRGRSPEKNKSLIGKLTGKGSSLYTSIKELLGISPENYLNDDQRLIYLNKFYWYMKKNMKEDTEFLKNIKARLANVKEREMKRIGVLAEGTPALNVLQKNIANLSQEYEEAATFRWYRNPKRFKSLKFIDFINQTCDELYHEGSFGKNANSFPVDFAYLQSCNVRVGAILFVLLSINDEYKSYKFLSPERSKLFKECLTAINVKSLQKISREKRIEWLRALSTHINILKLNKLAYRELAEKWEKAGIDVEKFLTKIEAYINQQEVKKAKPTWSRTIANYLVRCGIGLAAAQYTADLVLPAISTTVIGGLSGPIGMVVYLTGGTLLMTQLGRLVGDNLVPQGVSYLFAWLLDKVGATITNATADAATITVSITKEGLNALRGYPTLKPEDKEFIQDWIDTLLELPNDIMPEMEKDQIRYVLGVKEEMDTNFRVVKAK